MMTVIALIQGAVELLLAPFTSFSSWVGLTIVSLVSGVLFLLIYGKVSNQAKLRAVKRRIYAALLESVLFRHALPLSLKAQARMFWNGGVYFGTAIPPIIVLLVPCLILLGHMNQHYGVRGLKPGESAIVSVKVPLGSDLSTMAIEATGPIEVTPPVRVPSTGEAFVRVQAVGAEPGGANVTVALNGKSVQHEISLAAASRVSPDLYSSALWTLLFAGSSKAHPEMDLVVTYPERDYSLGGVGLHWIAIFAVLSIASGLVASRALRIEV